MSESLEELKSLEPQFVGMVSDRSIGLLGYVVVDTTIDGHSCGGLRFDSGVTVEELKGLARSMTLKYGFSGMAQGGAKAGISADPDMPEEKKRDLLVRFGEIIGPLLRSRFYISGTDMNTKVGDIDTMMRAAAMKVPSPRKSKGKKSGFFTALGVMVAAEAAAPVTGFNLAGSTVAIEGFGAVGSALGWLMTRKKGAKVVAVSTSRGAIHNANGLDMEVLLRLREKFGNACVTAYENAERIRNEDLLELNVDCLSPCARHHCIDLENVARIQARLVCPGANIPVTHEADKVLFSRGIVSVPPFSANCGGVLGNKVEMLGVDDEFIEAFIRRKNAGRILALIAESRKIGEAPIFLAERYAMSRFRTMQETAARGGIGGEIYRVGLKAFNAGLLPEPVLRPFAPFYLEKAMASDPEVRGEQS
jgi:glutamate dehydrogenase (NAD(P)+)